MQDKTAIGNNEHTNTPSKAFREYIEALVEEVVINGEPFDAQKKWLRKNSEAEGVDYATLEKNLMEFFETIEELKSHESKAGERLAKMLAKDCFLDEGKVNELVSAVNELREGVEQRASEEAKCEAQEETVNKAAIQGFVNGHEYVDLGLSSGTLWATCNVGASKPEDCGDFFAWGETQPKSDYDEGNYKHFDGEEYTKYTEDKDVVLRPDDDAASANWGVGWRMPTKEEFDEIRDNIPHVWTTQNGIDGWLFTASNGNTLFLPAAKSEGNYWMATKRGYFTNIGGAYSVFFNYCRFETSHFSKRYLGFSVRPVLVSDPFTYMRSRGGDIFDEMPGGHLLKEKTLDKTTV
jgi:hypothetical protein